MREPGFTHLFGTFPLVAEEVETAALASRQARGPEIVKGTLKANITLSGLDDRLFRE